jgi:hypothetical protein
MMARMFWMCSNAATLMRSDALKVDYLWAGGLPWSHFGECRRTPDQELGRVSRKPEPSVTYVHWLPSEG